MTNRRKSRKKQAILFFALSSAFAFSLCVAATEKSTMVQAADAELEALTWTWQSDYNYFTAEYSDNEYWCILAAQPDSGTFHRNDMLLELTCSISTNEGNAPGEFFGQQILFDYQVLGYSNEGEYYSFTATRDGRTDTLTIYTSILDVYGDDSQSDEYYFATEGDLYYHFEDGSETAVTITSLTYRTNLQSPEVAMNVYFSSSGSQQALVVGGVVFNPEPEESGNYTGTLECILPAGQETSELYLSDVLLTIDNGQQAVAGWQYSDGDLTYTSDTYTVSETRQVGIVDTGNGNFTIEYDIYSEGSGSVEDTLYVHFTEAEYTQTAGGNYYGYITGYCDVIDSNDPITVYARVEPEGSTDNNGWNYDENDNFLWWYDENYPDSTYEMDSATLKYDSAIATIVVKDTAEYDVTEHEAVLTEAVYDSTENTISGYMELNGVDRYLTVGLGQISLVEVEKWTYSNGTFIWVTDLGQEIRSSSLTIDSSVFYSHESTPENDTYELQYRYQNNLLPKLVLNRASYEQSDSATAQGYTVTGYCVYPTIQDTVTIVVASLEDRPESSVIDDGWYFMNEETGFLYFYNNNPVETVLSEAYFYQYGSSKNYATLIYTAVVDGQTETKVVTLLDATYRDPADTQLDYYIVSGMYEEDGIREISVDVAFLDVSVICYFVYENEFVYIIPDLGEELSCQISKVIFNNFGNGGSYNEAYVTLEPYRQYPAGNEVEESGISTIELEQCVLTTDPRYTQDGIGSITGKWINLDGEEQTVTINFNASVFIENNFQEATEGFHYVEGLGKLIYFDEMSSHYDVALVDATYNFTTEEVEVLCYVEEMDISTTLVLTTAYYRDRSLEDLSPRYEIGGYNENIFDGEMVLYLETVYTREDREPGFNYIDGRLVWFDEYMEAHDTEISFVTLFYTLLDEGDKYIEYAEIEYAIYSLNELDPDEITYKTVTLISIKFVDEPNELEQKPGFFTGIYEPLEDAVLNIEFYADQFEYKLFEKGPVDEEPATITPEQSAEIIQFLPEVDPVTPEEEERRERTAESLAQLSEKTAGDILDAVKTAQDNIDQELADKIAQAGEDQEAIAQAQQEHQEKREIIETVTEASVVVGAGQQTASDEGGKVDQALPEDSGLDSMDDTLNEFYQTQMDYLLGRKKAPEKRSILRDPTPVQSGIDMSISKTEYGKMIQFVDTAVSNMKNAALQIRKCSNAQMKAVVKDYIQVVKTSSFREYDKEAADAEFVEQAYKAIMLNMQQQVIEALKRDHKPSNNAQKELLYKQQLEACENYETFEEIVLEVLRLKYVSLTNEEIDIEDFRSIYDSIFRSWILDDASLNQTNISLEELTQATIETTTSKANKFTIRTDLTKQESSILIIIGVGFGVSALAGLTVPFILRRRKLGKELAK